MDLWTLDGTDEQTDEVIALFRFALGAAEESEVISPDTVTALRQWCTAESIRLHPKGPTPTPEQEVRAALQRSPHWRFWEALTVDQEVRWTGTKTATYFVVDPSPEMRDPDNPRSPVGLYIQLRRHSGKTFWTHIGKVRPLEFSLDQDKGEQT